MTSNSPKVGATRFQRSQMDLIMMPPLTTANMLLSIAGLALTIVSAPAVAQTASSAQEMAAANFRLADVDANGVLNSEEFVAFINLNAAQNIGQASRVKNAGAYDRAFARLDRDGNGLVAPEELANSGN